MPILDKPCIVVAGVDDISRCLPGKERKHKPGSFVTDETNIRRSKRQRRYIARQEHKKRHVEGIDKTKHKIAAKSIVIWLLNRVSDHDKKNG